ncbi:MAG: hypothetical protein QF632_00490 [Candidatus Woesearchaeota archaeon]|jgi:hypothetical protein|nr:hypothetical protein [Candidatus Woesearchaeota archaeon]MDP7458114.1 hypothetical protein [Candidatus Woesearchaeota archaeon]|tara:strand:- start:276 stop:743 length:468 start_codon:yes stop_codon:yes gene_type:complete
MKKTILTLNIEQIQRKIRKYVRLNKPFQKDDKIYVNSRFCKVLLKEILKDLPVTYVTTEKKANKVVIPWTLDDEINDFLQNIFQRKSLKTNQKVIKLLKPITDKEAALLAEKKDCHFTPNKKDPEIKHMIENLQKDHPEIKHGLLKTASELRSLD